VTKRLIHAFGSNGEANCCHFLINIAKKLAFDWLVPRKPKNQEKWRPNLLTMTQKMMSLV
jgi:hypothetical protein